MSLPDVSLEGDVNCSIPVLIMFNTCIDIARVLEQYRLRHLCDSSVRDTFVHCSKVLFNVFILELLESQSGKLSW